MIKGLRDLAHASNKSDKLETILKNLTSDKAPKKPLIPPRKKPSTEKTTMTKGTSPKIGTFIISPMDINLENKDNDALKKVPTTTETATDNLEIPKETTMIHNPSLNPTQRLATNDQKIIPDETKPWNITPISNTNTDPKKSIEVIDLEIKHQGTNQMTEDKNIDMEDFEDTTELMDHSNNLNHSHQHPEHPQKQSTKQQDEGQQNIRTVHQGKFRSAQPPFIVTNTKVTLLTSILVKFISIQNFIFKNLNNNKIAIYVKEYNEFKIVFDKLRENKIEFHTKTPNEEKSHSWLLRGIAGDFDGGDILAEILNMNLKNIIIKEVKKINLKDFFKAKRGGDAFLIKITNESDFKQLTKITRLANQMIWWDKIRHRNALQCFNCQRIGHTSRYCNMDYRCVKCVDNHGPGECKIESKNNINEKIYCINCKNYGHPASYRGCPTLLEYQNKINLKKNNMQIINEKKKAMIEKLIKPGITYAEITSKIAKEVHNINKINPNVNLQNDKIKFANSKTSQKQTMGDNIVNKPTKNTHNYSIESDETNTIQNIESLSPQTNEINKIKTKTPVNPNNENIDLGLESILNSFMGQIKSFIEIQIKQVSEAVQQNSQKIEFLYSQISNNNNG